RAIQEFEVTVDNFAVSRKPKRKLFLHRVKEQRLVAVHPSSAKHSLSWQRRNEDLGFNSRHRNMRDSRAPERKDSLLGKENVAVEPRALVTCLHDVHDAEE